MKQTAMILGLALLAMPAMAQKSRPAEMLLESARQKETVEGDLKGALRAYEDVVKRHAGDRAAVAKALMGMAECHQKLGDSEALRLYQRVAGEFADQKEAAQQARARMGQLRSRGAENMAVNRKVFTLPEGGDIMGTVSPDGRYVPYVNWLRKGNLYLRDLISGSDRQLTDTGTDDFGTPNHLDQYAEEYCFSRDGKQLVYSWFRGDKDRYELRVVSLQGTGVPAHRQLFDLEDVEWIMPHDWSPDGKWIAVSLQRKDRVAQIGLISAVDGGLRVLKSVDWRGPSSMYFSRDGRYVAYDLHSGESKLERDVYALAVDGSKEIPVVVHPSNDTVAGWTPDGRLLFVSDRGGSTDLWGMPFSDGTLDRRPELIKTGFEPSQTMGITNAGSLVYATNRPPGADLQTASFDFVRGTLVSPPVQAVHTFVGRNIAPSWSPDGKKLTWLSRRGHAGTRHFVIGMRDLESGQLREILPLPNFITLWTLVWEPSGRSFVATGRDLKGRGGIYRIDAESGKSTLLVDHGGFGLAVSPDGRYLYFAMRREEDGVLIRREIETGHETTVFQRKRLDWFVLSPDGRHLAMVEVEKRFPIAVQVISTEGGAVRELVRVSLPQRAGIFAFTPDKKALLVRKVLAPTSVELWRYPLDGGEPRKLEGGSEVPKATLFVHPDGKQVAFSVNLPAIQPEVWVLENFLPTQPGSN